MKITSTYGEITNKEEIKNDLLKPLHQYAQKISPKPLIENNIIYQKVYGEAVIGMLDNSEISMVSRPAIQQFHPIHNTKYKVPDFCFTTLFEFYISWFPDIDKDVKISTSLDKESPFFIPEDLVINFGQLYKDPKEDLPHVWVPFFVRKDYLQFKKEYAKIELGTIAYQIEM